MTMIMMTMMMMGGKTKSSDILSKSMWKAELSIATMQHA